MGTTASQAEEQAIRERVRAMVEAVGAKNPDHTAQFYAEDGVLLWPGTPLTEGRPAIREAWANFMQMPGFELTFWPVRIELAEAGDMAVEVGAFRLMGQEGKSIVTWKKVGGEWQIMAAAPNMNAQGS
jgi:uncharacterized protein (TIGR02246 family)